MAAAAFGSGGRGCSGLSLPARSALGVALGLLLMLPGPLLGATGAGDVKLMAAVGAIVGPGADRPGVSLHRGRRRRARGAVAARRGRLATTLAAPRTW